MYNIAAGNKPKDIRSAKESNCFPILETALSILALNPSKKSKTAANPIKYAAAVKFPPKASTIPTHPQSKLQQVKKLGIFFLIRFKASIR